MGKGDKSKYTDKQKRQADHIEESYKDQGVAEDEAERRAWATVNKQSGGGKKSGSGRDKSLHTAASKREGRKGGQTSKTRKGSSRPKRSANTKA